MRWWLNTDDPKLFSVDNSSVKGMDFSILPPDLWMVHWTEGKGEIEYQTEDGQNLNGLREDFYDITPYTSLFQQFLELLPGLTLDQAKKVQIDLIKQLYESKRQMPFHYPVASGDYWWDASDTGMYGSTSAGLQNTNAKVNELVARLNSLVTSLLNAQLVVEINSNVANGVNSIVVPGVNAAVSAYNAGVVAIGNSLRASINSQIVAQTNAIKDHVNISVIGVFDGATGNPEDINNRLRDRAFPSTPPTDIRGLSSNIALISNACSALGEVFSGASSINGINGVNNLPWTPITNVSASNVQWIPIGATEPVNVTPAEQAAIMAGITARTNELNLIKNQKIGEVNALTDTQAVIDYDVLADWPVSEAPPGFKLEPPVIPPSGGVTVVGTPTVTEGVPEAPSDGITYGRRNQTWDPALALSGNTLDGGSF